jgi:hypothetical protein
VRVFQVLGPMMNDEEDDGVGTIFSTGRHCIASVPRPSGGKPRQLLVAFQIRNGSLGMKLKFHGIKRANNIIHQRSSSHNRWMMQQSSFGCCSTCTCTCW